MATNAQKTHLTRELNRWSETQVAQAIQKLGKALPCSVVAVAGSIVSVKFEVISGFTLPIITIPMFGPEYLRYPTQIGDLGVTVAADTYLGGISGLGGGVADLTLPANLSALFFMPLASNKWSVTDDPNKAVLYGPDGVVIRTVDKSASITVTQGGNTIQGNTEVVGTLNVTVNLIVDGIGFNSHFHELPGGGNTGPPL